MKRRELLVKGAVGGLLAAAAAGVAEAGSAQAVDRDERDRSRVADAIEHVRAELQAEHAFSELAAIRAGQKQHLRANNRLPGFIDVGVDVWFDVFDWHVRWQHPLVEGRDTQGRLTLLLNHTQLVLRPDVQSGHVGLPYDA